MTTQASTITPYPLVGSDEFKRLPFGKQVEIIAICFFRDRIDTNALSIDHRGHYDRVKIEIRYPAAMAKVPEGVALIDIAPSHYASYLAQFDDRFFARVHGATLDRFQIVPHALSRKIWSFNFPLLSLDVSLYYIFKYVHKIYFLGSQEPAALFFALKIFLFLEMCAKTNDETYHELISKIKKTYLFPKRTQTKKIEKIIDQVMFDVQRYYEAHPVKSLHDLNTQRDGACTLHFPQIMHAFHALEFMIFSSARFKKRRALFPMIPYDFFVFEEAHHHFKVLSWELFDDKLIDRCQAEQRDLPQSDLAHGCTVG